MRSNADTMIERGSPYVGFCGLLKLYKVLSWQDTPFLLGIEPKRHKRERFKNCVGNLQDFNCLSDSSSVHGFSRHPVHYFIALYFVSLKSVKYLIDH